MGDALGGVPYRFTPLNHGDHHRRTDQEAIEAVEHHGQAVKEIDVDLAVLAQPLPGPPEAQLGRHQDETSDG